MQEERIKLLTPAQEKCVLVVMYVPLPAFLLCMLLLAVGIAGPVGPEPWLMVFALIGVFVFIATWLVRSLGLYHPDRKRVLTVTIVCGVALVVNFLRLDQSFVSSLLTQPLLILIFLALPFALFLAPRYKSRYGR
jgi:hypothetical protein